MIAARASDIDTVGTAVALVGYVLFLADLASLGLPVVVARFASGLDPIHRGRFWTLCALGAAAEMAVGLAFVAIVDSDALDSLHKWNPIGGALLLGAACAGTSLSAVADIRALALGRHGLMVARSACVVAGRLVLFLPAIALGGSVWLFAAAVIPVIASGLVGSLLLSRPPAPGYSIRADPELLDISRCMGANYCAQLVSAAPISIVPVVVSLRVAPDENAPFFIAWGITTMCFVLPVVLGSVILAQSGHDRSLGRQSGLGALSLALQVAAAGMLVIGLAVLPLRALVPYIYGDDYKRTADLLPLLVVAGVCWAVTSMMLTLNRLRHADRAVLLVAALAGILSIAPTVALTWRYGTDGTALGWFVGNLAASLMAVAITLGRGPFLDLVPLASATGASR